jgi:DNA-binding MurR/RpiR family transcriptional regulator
MSGSPEHADTEAALLHRIAARLPYLPAALRQVAELILRDPDAARLMSITSLASSADVAESTVSRFVREIGLASYSELRLGITEAAFANRVATHGPEDQYVYNGVDRGDSTEDILRKITSSSSLSLQQTARSLDATALDSATALIEKANLIVFACMGASSIAAEEGVMRFTRAGKRCLLYRDQSIQAMLATIVGPGDVVIALSDSGRSTPVIEVIRQSRAHGAATIAITSDDDSPVAKSAEVVLFTSAAPSGGALYGEAVAAKWGQLLVVDTLYATFAARHFDRTLAHLQETFAAGIKQSRLSN